MKAGKKITLLEKSLDFVLLSTMKATKNNIDFAQALDICTTEHPDPEVIIMLEASADRIKGKV